MLELQKFIIDHPDNFRELLSEKPYCLKLNETNSCILFKYNQIDSDFNNPIVCESRGIILYKEDWSIACHPFHKFFNYGEDKAATIDWSSAKVQTKYDGSIIKMWFDRIHTLWTVSTNGCINADDAELVSKTDSIQNYYDLFAKAFSSFKGLLNRDYTYIFELCSPLNRVVVPYTETFLVHLATKNNKTGEEIFTDIGFIHPKEYSLNSLDECINAAKNLPFSEEGYVIVDKYFNRIKIKSPAYLMAHRLRGEGALTEKRALDLIRINEHGEYLVYFPEDKEFFDNVERKLNRYLDKLEADRICFIMELRHNEGMKTRKDKALYIMENCINPAIMFQLLDEKIKVSKEGVEKISTEKLLAFINKYEER